MSKKDFFEICFQSMEGWCTPEKAQDMYEAALVTDSQVIVELGVFGGRSALALGEACKETGGVVYAIDPWSKEAVFEGDMDEKGIAWWNALDLEMIYVKCVNQLLAFGFSKYVNILRMKSERAISLFEAGSVDVLHQDGNHSELVSCAEVRAWVPKMKPSGVWIFDDKDWSSLQAAQKMLVEEYGFKVILEGLDYRIYKR